MNEAGDFSLTHNGTPDSKTCSIISIIPDLGMASCRGRAEAFARSLSSKLRTLGSQNDDEEACPEDEPIMNGGGCDNAANNSWIVSTENNQTITKLQPLRNEQEAYYDFECELESPGSPVDECEYLRLIETASNTPHNSVNELADECDCTDGNHISNTDQFSGISPVLPQFEDSLNLLNGSKIQSLTNGYHPPHQNGENIHETVEVENCSNHEGSEELQHNNITAKPDKPTIGPDESAIDLHHHHHTAVENNEEEQNCKLQEEVINELQKQSDIVNKSQSPTKDEAIVENQENLLRSTNPFASELHDPQPTEESCPSHEEVPPSIDLSSNQEEISPSHVITNGHHEDGEEYVKIEVIECSSNSPSQHNEEDAEKGKEELPTEAPVAPQLCEESPAPKILEEEVKTTAPKTTHSCLDATDDEDDCRPQRVRRCSSLKTGKTPPGTPGRKKIVRFADVLGLDLADVKTFLDEIPNIPKSAYEDLEIMDSEPPLQLGPKSNKLLMPLFQQPGGLPTFLDQVREKQVSLENAAVTDAINQTITGSVRVRNLDFHKSVHIRYSLDGWRSYADLQANYVPNSCDGFSDKFQFTIFGNSLNIGQRIEMAVRFQCKGQQYWDNNYDANYCFQCLPTSSPVPAPVSIGPSHHSGQLVGLMSPTVGETWCGSFY